MKDIFWEEYPENDNPPAALPQAVLNGPCMLHGRLDCHDCCPELAGASEDDYDYYESDATEHSS